MMNANSYAGPKQEAPCTAPTTIGPGSLTKASHAPRRALGVVDIADRLRMALGAEALDLVEGELRAGGDDEVVVVEEGAVAQLDLVLFRVNAPGARRVERDAFLRQVFRGREFDFAALAPAHRHPGVGRNEMEIRAVADDGQLVAGLELFLHLVSHRHAAEARADDDDTCHVLFSSREWPANALILQYMTVRPGGQGRESLPATSAGAPKSPLELEDAGRHGAGDHDPARRGRGFPRRYFSDSIQFTRLLRRSGSRVFTIGWLSSWPSSNLALRPVVMCL